MPTHWPIPWARQVSPVSTARDLVCVAAVMHRRWWWPTSDLGFLLHTQVFCGDAEFHLRGLLSPTPWQKVESICEYFAFLAHILFFFSWSKGTYFVYFAFFSISRFSRIFPAHKCPFPHILTWYFGGFFGFLFCFLLSYQFWAMTTPFWGYFGHISLSCVCFRPSKWCDCILWGHFKLFHISHHRWAIIWHRWPHCGPYGHFWVIWASFRTNLP